MRDLFADIRPEIEWLRDGVALLPGFADSAALLPLIRQVAAVAPFRHLVTPGGHRMSVAMTNCGDVGWTSEPSGYRYAARDPVTGQAWPAMPGVFMALATSAAAKAGFSGARPDACLINRYSPGSALSLHQDRDERDMRWPIVSVSIGVAATFVMGGLQRGDPTTSLTLRDGDVLVWGGAARGMFHGIRRLHAETHPLTGADRFNITFRRAT
jgi:alkylated DNA repair protein (DNA oxidative demethylase)